MGELAGQLLTSWPLDNLKTSDSPGYDLVVTGLLTRMRASHSALPKGGVYLQSLVDHFKVILCNLHVAHSVDPTLFIEVHLDRSVYKADSDYRGFQFSAGNVRRVVSFLLENGFIELYTGYPGSSEWGAQLTKMRATQGLLDLLEASGADPASVYQDITHVETVVMKGKKKLPPKRQWKNGKRPKPKREVIRTPDKPIIRQMRANLALINEVIRQADIDIDLDLFELEELNRRLSGDPDRYKRPGIESHIISDG